MLSKLKISWMVLAAKALRNSSFRVICPREISVFVTVVPIFAPIITGIAAPKSRVPLATYGIGHTSEHEVCKGLPHRLCCITHPDD